MMSNSFSPFPHIYEFLKKYFAVHYLNYRPVNPYSFTVRFLSNFQSYRLAEHGQKLERTTAAVRLYLLIQV